MNRTGQPQFVKSDYRTQVQMPVYADMRLTHSDAVLMLGSCFTDEIGSRLYRDMFDVLHNPFGEQYNPLSVADALERIIEHRKFCEEELVADDAGVWHSWALHSRFSSVDKDRVLRLANEALERAHALLFSGDRQVFVMVTFGTAYYYRLVSDNGMAVANCHKFPAGKFARHRLGLEDIVNVWDPLLERLSEKIPEVKVLVTVSPVRYLSYGPQDNSLSKAVLLLAAESLCRHHAVHYFPAFELVNDDLRDYRFYSDDMVHPSKQGADYVYSGLLGSICNDETLGLVRQCRSLVSRFAHRPLVDNPSEYQRFITAARHEVDVLINNRPELAPRRQRFYSL